MNAEELKSVLDSHKKWLYDEPGSERANLMGADLMGADLRGANLTGANLTGANLAGSYLMGAYLTEANLWEANLMGANLTGANLWKANLMGADLRGADLRGADLRGADLTGADLARADLRGADLRGADLTGAKLNWNSHQLSSEILLRSAGKDPEKRKVAGLIRISPDWCWPQFLALDDPLTDWALDELAKWVQDGDSAPAVLVSRRKVSSSNCPQVVAVR